MVQVTDFESRGRHMHFIASWELSALARGKEEMKKSTFNIAWKADMGWFDAGTCEQMLGYYLIYQYGFKYELININSIILNLSGMYQEKKKGKQKEKEIV